MEHYETEHSEHFHDSALKVNAGIEQPPVVSPYFQKKKRHNLTTQDYIDGILAGNISILSQAITLIESLCRNITLNHRKSSRNAFLTAGTPSASESPAYQGQGNPLS